MKRYTGRIIWIVILFSAANLLLLEALVPFPKWSRLPLLILMAACCVVFHIRPRKINVRNHRLRTLIGGYEILFVSFIIIGAEMILYLVLLVTKALDKVPFIAFMGTPGYFLLIVNLLFFVPVVVLFLLNGFFRVLITSKYLRVLWRLLLMLFWWVPFFNMYLFYRVLKAVRREYFFERARIESEKVHAENLDCRTKYPIVLVHGIFFRDWQIFGYWGRIPKALSRCGAEIYYGKQQSSLAVADSAAELAAQLQKILVETGAEKLNIIAHSKGGLDSRYAVSRLGMAPYVASLTTINTPHRGVVFGQILLKKLPGFLILQVDKHYNKLFHILGDTKPDFLGGVRDLTAERCRIFNEETPDAEGVLYQSVMSYMKKPSAAGFPLNFTWYLVKKCDGELSDGLVARSSALWGQFLGEVSVQGKRGISHGDMIDLMREDIEGFDVREFYIELVKGLKEKGL